MKKMNSRTLTQRVTGRTAKTVFKLTLVIVSQNINLLESVAQSFTVTRQARVKSMKVPRLGGFQGRSIKICMV